MRDTEIEEIEKIEELSRIDRKSGELVSEYLNRVGAQYGMDDDLVRTVTGIYHERSYAPDLSLTRDERASLDRFYTALQRSTPRNTNQRSDRDPASRLDIDASEGEGEGGEDGPTTASEPRAPNAIGTREDAATHAFSARRLGRGSRTAKRISERHYEVIDQHARSLYSWLVRDARDAAFIFTLILSGALIYYRKLGAYPLRNWDEGLYATAASNMVREGTWLIPHVNWVNAERTYASYAFLQKPPLSLWLQGISLSIFGDPEFAVRFPSATATILIACATYIFGRELRDQATGLVAALVFLTVRYNYLGNNAGRFGGTDMLHTLLGTLFVLTVWLAVDRDDDWWLVPVGVVGGLTVLVKGFAAGIFVFSIIPLFLINPRVFLSRRLGTTVVIGAVIVVPWVLYAYLRYGQIFVREIFIDQVLARAAGGLSSYSGAMFGFMNYPYFREFPSMFDPWIYLLVPLGGAYLALTARKRDLRGLKYGLFLAWWATFVLVFFAYTGNHPWYLIPMFVPSALLVGLGVSCAIAGDPTAKAGGVIGILTSLLFSLRMGNASPFARLDGSLRWEGIETGFVLVALVGAVVIVWAGPLKRLARSRLGREEYRTSTYLVPSLTVVLVVLLLTGPPAMNAWGAEYGQYLFSEDVDRQTADRDTIYIEPAATSERPLFTFAFYTPNPLRKTSIGKINEDESIRVALVRSENGQRLERSHNVIGEFSQGGAIAVKFTD